MVRFFSAIGVAGSASNGCCSLLLLQLTSAPPSGEMVQPACTGGFTATARKRFGAINIAIPVGSNTALSELSNLQSVSEHCAKPCLFSSAHPMSLPYLRTTPLYKDLTHIVSAASCCALWPQQPFWLSRLEPSCFLCDEQLHSAYKSALPRLAAKLLQMADGNNNGKQHVRL